MIEVWRGRQRKPRKTEDSIVIHHFVARPDNPLEVAGVGALRRFDEYGLAPGAEIPVFLSPRSAKVVFVLEGELVCRCSGQGNRSIGPHDALAVSGAREDEAAVANEPGSTRARFLFLTVAASADLEPMLKTVHVDRQASIGTPVPFISGQGHPGAVPLTADAALYFFSIRRSEHLIFETVPSRSTYVHLLDGSLRTGEVQLQAGDSARFRRENEVQLSAVQRCEGILADVAERTGEGG